MGPSIGPGHLCLFGSATVAEQPRDSRSFRPPALGLTDTHRDTIMRLMVKVGTGCAALVNDQMRNLGCQRIQCDEIWTYVGKKQARLKAD
jgi:hypothetical protein